MENPKVMQAFLTWLGGDISAGGRKYEEIRRGLILLFRYMGCHVPEELADETIDRTARAVLKPDFECYVDHVAYFRGVARNVHSEWVRSGRKMRLEPIPEAGLEVPAPKPASVMDEAPLECLDLCLNTLPPAKRTLLIRYYQSEKREKVDGRQIIAEELGIGLNALRIQVFRLRNAMRECVEKCTAKREMESPFEA